MKLTIPYTYSHKILLLITVFLFTGIYVMAEESWHTKINGTKNYWISDVATDNNGNVYAVGGFDGYLLIEGEKYQTKSGLNIFFAKFDISGNLEWLKQFDGDGEVWAKEIIHDNNGNIYMGVEYENSITIEESEHKATYNNNLLIARFDESGNMRWIKDISGKDDKRIHGMAIDHIGNIYVGGAFSHTLDVEGRQIKAAGGEDAFILKLSPHAKLEWIKHVSSTKNVAVHDLSIGTDLIGVTGSFTGQLTLDNIEITNTGNELDIWIAALDPGGNILWSEQPEGSYDDIPTVIAVDNSNNVIVAGSFKLNMDFDSKRLTSYKDADVFLAKYDARGDFRWAKQGIGSVKSDFASDMAVDNHGNILLIGSYLGSIRFDNVGVVGPSNVHGPTAESVYLVKSTANGEIVHARHLGSIEQIKYNVIHRSSENNIVIATSLDEFIEDPATQEVQMGEKTNSTIYIWKTDNDNSLFEPQQLMNKGSRQLDESRELNNEDKMIKR